METLKDVTARLATLEQDLQGYATTAALAAFRPAINKLQQTVKDIQEDLDLAVTEIACFRSTADNARDAVEKLRPEIATALETGQNVTDFAYDIAEVTRDLMDKMLDAQADIESIWVMLKVIRQRKNDAGTDTPNASAEELLDTLQRRLEKYTEKNVTSRFMAATESIVNGITAKTIDIVRHEVAKIERERIGEEQAAASKIEELKAVVTDLENRLKIESDARKHTESLLIALAGQTKRESGEALSRLYARIAHLESTAGIKGPTEVSAASPSATAAPVSDEPSSAPPIPAAFIPAPASDADTPAPAPPTSLPPQQNPSGPRPFTAGPTHPSKSTASSSPAKSFAGYTFAPAPEPYDPSNPLIDFSTPTPAPTNPTSPIPKPPRRPRPIPPNPETRDLIKQAAADIAKATLNVGAMAIRGAATPVPDLGAEANKSVGDNKGVREDGVVATREVAAPEVMAKRKVRVPRGRSGSGSVRGRVGGSVGVADTDGGVGEMGRGE
ncbi:hypothetical protein BDV95DRAFT_609949 [Massariosphaeria phaeospora]|uniref:Uncharacterized protein n=1 Tax=Massariosphaeria phaeospora TaxID=100035 RepID=A0A7C8I1N5_9PLEO|nr:hypothetical protein BDV95DRAFT_609949 [Massariosphaeria phaeospora]